MRRLTVALLTAVSLVGGPRAAAREPLALLDGGDFEGGANAEFGSAWFGQPSVNYVYARATESHSTMTARFTLDAAPTGELFLHLTACDDDADSACLVGVALNGVVLHSGPSGHPNRLWATRRLAIPSGCLRPGENEIVIRNLHDLGALGMPPWFMVCACAIAEDGYEPKTPGPTDGYAFELPRARRPLPEPLPEGVAAPGFALRGTKGWGWTPEQYLAEIPILERCGMNFLMNCYLSLFSDPAAWKNEWWLPLSAEKKAAYREVIRSCKEHHITFCFAAHPQLGAPRRLDPTSLEDIDRFWRHYAWAQSEGVTWFNVSLDDVDWGDKGPAVGGAEHARFVNEIFRRLRARDPDAQLSFVPVPYWGDGTQPDHRAYLEALGAELHPDVYVFWTGDGVVTPTITRKAAESYRSIVKHRLILWDNYPVNDNAPTLHLGPLTGRDKDLREVLDGYMSNPMATQNEASRIPLLTCADYAHNPWLYDPRRSIGQAILHLAPSSVKSRVLARLVEAYPGMLIFGGGTGTNPVRERFRNLAGDPATQAQARGYVREIESLASALRREFPGRFEATKRTVEADVAWMKEQLPAEGVRSARLAG